ncbi:MAG: hypothetical protein DHS20C03_35750 [Minwuia thermotolerans]|nr:MAG: hypothetical protein DHS20C03_35750 [Minwuia thermotolerans]
MRIGDCREIEALRGLRADQMFPVLRAGHLVAVDAAETVDHRQGWQDRRTAFQRIADTRDQRIIDKGTRCIMNQHMSWCCAGECGQTRRDRLLPCFTTHDRWQKIEAEKRLIVKVPLPGTDDHLHQVNARVRQERGNSPPQHRLTIQVQILLGQFAAQACAVSGCDNQCSSLHCVLPLTEKGATWDLRLD